MKNLTILIVACLTLLSSCNSGGGSYRSAAAKFDARDFESAILDFDAASRFFEKNNDKRMSIECRIYIAWAQIERGELGYAANLASLILEAENLEIKDEPLIMLAGAAKASALLAYADYAALQAVLSDMEENWTLLQERLEKAEINKSTAAERALVKARKLAEPGLSRMPSLWLAAFSGQGDRIRARTMASGHIDDTRNAGGREAISALLSGNDAEPYRLQAKKPVRDPQTFFALVLYGRASWKPAENPDMLAYYDFAARYFDTVHQPCFAAYTRFFLGREVEALASVNPKEAPLTTAISAYTSALPVFMSIQKDDYAANCLARMGIIKSSLGQYFEARGDFEQALPLFEKLRADKEYAETINYMASLDKTLGNLGLAEKNFLKAEELFGNLNDTASLAAVRNNLGVIYALSGEWQKAEMAYGSAVSAVETLLLRSDSMDEAARLKLVEDRAAKINNIAELLISRDESGRAVRDYLEPLASSLEAQGLSQGMMAGTVLLNRSRCGLVALAAAASGDGYDRASFTRVNEMITGAEKLFTAIGNKGRIQAARYLKGRLAFTAENFDLAETLFAEAVEFYRKSRDLVSLAGAAYDLSVTKETLKKEAESIASLKESTDALDTYLRLIPSAQAQERHFLRYSGKFKLLLDRQIKAGLDAEAFHTAQRMKSRLLLQRLAMKKINPLSGIPSRLRDRLLELDRYETALVKGYEDAESSTFDYLDNLEERLEAVKTERADLFRQIRVINADAADIGENAATNAVAVQEVLSDGECLLEYAISDTGIYAFLVGKDRIKAFKLSDNTFTRAKLTASIMGFAGLLKNPGTDARLQADVFYRLLLAPLADGLLRYKNICVVPADEIFFIPLDALYDSTTKKWVKDDGFAPFSYVPSATLWVSLRGRKPATFAKSYLGIGDPDYKGRFPQLPGALNEVKSAATLWPDSRMLTGTAATESAVRSLDLSSYRVLHFSCHGISYGDGFGGINVPALLLASDAAQDGFFQYEEISAMNVKADMVVLSACKTGIGKLAEGEGMVGLHYAFFIAGSRHVVSSLWSVDDHYTFVLLSFFLKKIAGGSEATEALRNAMEETGSVLRREGMPDSPYFWAPFVIYG